uniref:long-chain-fatty-acid--CoA ligase n=1 Tax=Heterorhabditis bacteriophora TaxID=37862 RepID=A0A1I7XHS7_HETBA
MGKKKNTDFNHNFPIFEQFSRLVPGEERIRENVFVDKPIEVPPDGVVTTVYEALEKAATITSNGEFLGEIINGKYKWKTYKTVIHDAQVIGSALVHLGLRPGEETRVGIAGIHSVNEIITNCNLELVFCDNDNRAEEFIQKKMAGILPNMKKIIVLNSVKKQVNGRLEGIDDLEVYSYEYIYNMGEANLKPAFPPSPTSVYIICHTSGTTVITSLKQQCALYFQNIEDIMLISAFIFSITILTKIFVHICCQITKLKVATASGRPKGVQLTHRSLLASMAGLYTQWVPPPNRFSFGKNDVYFSFLSLAHIYEHLMQTFTIYIGGRVGIYSGDVTKLVADIQILRPTIVSLVPRLLNKFHDHIHAEISKKNVLAKKLFEVAKEVSLTFYNRNYDFSIVEFRDMIQFGTNLYLKREYCNYFLIHNLFGGRLRILTTGGAPVTPAVKDFTRIAYGCPLMEGYGQTECGAAGTLNLPFDFTTGQVGGPAPWAQIKLIDVPEMNYWAKDDKGEICFRGAAVMNGYFMDDELNRRTIDSEASSNSLNSFKIVLFLRWLHTGDIGMWLPNGALQIIDRKNALFKLAQGDFVSPEQIEAVYLNCPLLIQLFVTGKTTRSFLVGIGIVNIPHLRAALSSSTEDTRQTSMSDIELLEDSDVRNFVLRELNILGKENGLQTMELIKNIYLTGEFFIILLSFIIHGYCAFLNHLKRIFPQSSFSTFNPPQTPSATIFIIHMPLINLRDNMATELRCSKPMR